MDRDQPYIVIEKGRNGLGTFLIGALIGAGAALLLAPKSGEETQEELKAQARRWRDVAEQRVKEAQSNLEDRLDLAREGVHDRLEVVRDAVDAGRQAARDARGDLERKLEQSKAAYRAGIDAAREATHDPGEPLVESNPAIES